MDSRLIRGGGFAFAMTWRTLLAAGLAMALIQVLVQTHYYATALVLAALTAITIADATRLYSRLGAAVGGERGLTARDQARQIDRMAGLLDAVTVALIAVGQDGRIAYANRAARLLAGEEVGRLTDLRALGRAAAEAILALPVGARRIITLDDGRTMLVWIGQITAPGAESQKLISLQAVTGELDAVQARAWADMVRVLSHEMMNSLTPISSLSESLPHLLAAHDEAAAMGAVETIARRSRHLMNFVERYRQIADLPPPEPRIISLSAFAADIDALMRAHLKGIAWACREDEGMIAADPDLLSQAIINLLRNAAEAAALGPAPAVSLDIARSDGGVRFLVRDNGPGIAPEHLPEIFVPFFTTKQGGSGIGLTLARQIALAHGGRLEAGNHEDGGAAVSLWLPDAAPRGTASG